MTAPERTFWPFSVPAKVGISVDLAIRGFRNASGFLEIIGPSYYMLINHMCQGCCTAEMSPLHNDHWRSIHSYIKVSLTFYITNLDYYEMETPAWVLF